MRTLNNEVEIKRGSHQHALVDLDAKTFVNRLIDELADVRVRLIEHRRDVACTERMNFLTPRASHLAESQHSSRV